MHCSNYGQEMGDALGCTLLNTGGNPIREI